MEAATYESPIPPSYDTAVEQTGNPPVYIQHQSSIDDQITVISDPLPPSYGTLSNISPSVILQAAADANQRCAVTKLSTFRVPDELRRTRNAHDLYNSIIDRREQPATTFRANQNLQPVEKHDFLRVAFFQAVSEGSEELVSQFLALDLLSANTSAYGLDEGLTPLLCAIRHQQTQLIPCLVTYGANINAFGIYYPLNNAEEPESSEARERFSRAVVRTPLQLAASLGQLTTVKCLREVYGADDSVIAPDGQMALRLASANGHTDVVEYLPARRGGGYLRWKTKHGKSMKRLRKSAYRLADVTTQITYHIPKALIFGSWHAARVSTMYCWRNKNRIIPACRKLLLFSWKVVKTIPFLMLAAIVGSGMVLKAAPGVIGRVVIHLCTKTIPKVSLFLYRICKRSGMAIGGAFVWIANRVVSFLHTVCTAIVSAFRRVKWMNIRNGFNDVLRAVFVEFPKTFGPGLRKIFRILKKTTKVLLSCFGGMILCCLAIPYVAIEFLIKHIWRMVSSVCDTVVEGGKEIHVCFNPKA